MEIQTLDVGEGKPVGGTYTLTIFGHSVTYNWDEMPDIKRHNLTQEEEEWCREHFSWVDHTHDTKEVQQTIWLT